MIDPRRTQFSFGDRLIAEVVDGLYEAWMVHADEVLVDDEIVMAAYEALARRHRLRAVHAVGAAFAPKR
jgi:hypothetical protein